MFAPLFPVGGGEACVRMTGGGTVSSVSRGPDS